MSIEPHLMSVRSGNQPTRFSVSAVAFAFALMVCGAALGSSDRPKAPPRMQVIPLPNEQASFQRDGMELTRYHFGPSLKRPFLFPVQGPEGRSLTRMGHPGAPVSHSHHNSIWISHNDVNGESFWADNSPCRVRHQWVVEYQDGAKSARMVTVNHWLGKDGKPLLVERRGIEARDLGRGEWLLILDLHLEAASGAVTLGKTPFGLPAARMAKNLGVNDGGGVIRNSAGNRNEQGPNGCFWKPARWVDYSGAIAEAPDGSLIQEGITLMDHPGNPNHPSVFHVRNDGWMGSSFTFGESRVIQPGKPLRLRYGFLVHRSMPPPAEIEAQWRSFAQLPRPELPNYRR